MRIFPPKHTIMIVLTVLCAVGAGLFIAAGFVYGGRFALSHSPLKLSAQVSKTSSSPSSPSSPSVSTPIYSKITLGSLSQDLSSLPQQGKALYVDLDAMTLSLYSDGTVTEKVPVMSKGRIGTPWETPPGVYKVETKEENHFSSIGTVWMPYSMQFFGNFFIHGWPYYPGGTPVPKGYSGGCIRLSTEDAKKVFLFADTGTPLIVVGKNSSSATSPDENFYYIANLGATPRVSAGAYLVADLDSGDILLEHNSGREYPIASLTKLITALTSLDVVNQYQTARVSSRASATYGNFGGLKEGEAVSVGTLLYPLLLESSNDAAEVIAEHYGRDRFLSQMNKKARSIGLNMTHFDDPSGLSPGNTSTAQDLFTLAQYIYRHKSYVLGITKTAVKKVEKESPSAKTHTWYNNNYFVVKGDPKYLGGKNGYTDAAGRTLISLFSLPLSEFQKRDIAVIVLASENREKDAEKLVQYVSKNIYFGLSPDAKRLAVQSVATPELTRGQTRESVWSAMGKRMVSSLGILATSTASSSKQVRLLFVGDIMADRGVRSVVERSFSGDYQQLFARARTIADYDISFANLEGPVSLRGTDHGSIYSFRMDPKLVPALKKVGFDVLSVANNHAGDWGGEAFYDTISQVSEYGILPVGGGYDRTDAVAVKILERNGVRVGFLGFTDVGPDWLEVGAKNAGVLRAADGDFDTLIAHAARQVDALVVSFHFGDEYQPLSNARQKALARRAVENGARIVVGHHPHVVQELERYNGGVIAYSLGNFIFDQNFSPETMQGLGLMVTLNAQGGVEDVRRLPFSINKSYQPELDVQKKK